eukprot:2121539-Heterocapsa_arctica.AAC.1
MNAFEPSPFWHKPPPDRWPRGRFNGVATSVAASPADSMLSRDDAAERPERNQRPQRRRSCAAAS